MEYYRTDSSSTFLLGYLPAISISIGQVLCLAHQSGKGRTENNARACQVWRGPHSSPFYHAPLHTSVRHNPFLGVVGGRSRINKSPACTDTSVRLCVGVDVRGPTRKCDSSPQSKQVQTRSGLRTRLERSFFWRGFPQSICKICAFVSFRFVLFLRLQLTGKRQVTGGICISKCICVAWRRGWRPAVLFCDNVYAHFNWLQSATTPHCATPVQILNCENTKAVSKPRNALWEVLVKDLELQFI